MQLIYCYGDNWNIDELEQEAIFYIEYSYIINWIKRNK